MKNYHIPDIENLYNVVMRKKTEHPVLFEFIIDDVILRRHSHVHKNAKPGGLEYFMMIVDAYKNLGYDYAPLYPWATDLFSFKRIEHIVKESYSLNEGALITDWASFEKYVWSNPDDCDYSIFEKIKPYLPDGMKLLGCSNGGILENAMEICGFENLCMMGILEPDLTKEIFEHIGKRLYGYYKIVSAFDSVGILMVNDDWGFKTQTMFPPQMMRDYLFPWTKKIVEAIHENGKLAILHSCGNLNLIMDEIISDLRIDARHSFEDGIIPIEEAYDIWHDRIALMGGIDVDFLTLKTPVEIKERAFRLLEKTANSGGYALGSGNSITSYTPEENFLALISAAIDFES